MNYAESENNLTEFPVNTEPARPVQPEDRPQFVSMSPKGGSIIQVATTGVPHTAQTTLIPVHTTLGKSVNVPVSNVSYIKVKNEQQEQPRSDYSPSYHLSQIQVSN